MNKRIEFLRLRCHVLFSGELQGRKCLLSNSILLSLLSRPLSLIRCSHLSNKVNNKLQVNNSNHKVLDLLDSKHRNPLFSSQFLVRRKRPCFAAWETDSFPPPLLFSCSLCTICIPKNDTSLSKKARIRILKN